MNIPIGIQLYTLREECQRDFTGTLRALAAMGYQGVEFAWNYGGLAPRDLAGLLHELRLQCAGLHVGLPDILDANSSTYAYARAMNATFLTTSLCGEVAKDWPAAIDNMARAAAVAWSQGMVFTYHNHAQEMSLVNGALAEDLVLARPSLIQFELDTYWIRQGGQDPAALIRRYAGRAPQIHLKDMDPADGSFTEVGRGCLDWPEILAAAAAGGARWLIVEQDVCRRPPLESARLSVENLAAMNIAR